MALKDITIKRRDMILVDPRALTELPEYNSRNMSAPETFEHIRKMANAMKENGVANFPPITISQEKDGNTYLYAGYCRRRAALLAIEEGAPLIGLWAIANNQTAEERILDLLTSNDGLPLTMLEKANVVNRLIAFEWTVPMIAQKLGVSAKAVYDLVSLTQVPEEVKVLVADGKVSATLAVETVKENPDTAAEKLKGAVDTAEAEGKTKATRKHMADPAGDKLTKEKGLKFCPFCGVRLELETAEVWRHPEGTCYLSGATVDRGEEKAWNTRVR